MYMSNDKRLRPQKPFDIRERLFVFACDVVDVAQKLHTRGPIAGSLSIQLVSAAVSAASNAEEADDGSSAKGFRAKERICLRELKEARLRLRVLRATGFLEPSDDGLISESNELRLIVSTIIRNSARKHP
jgi:four helix bundle protein